MEGEMTTIQNFTAAMESTTFFNLNASDLFNPYNESQLFIYNGSDPNFNFTLILANDTDARNQTLNGTNPRLDGREPHNAFARYYPFIILMSMLSILGIILTVVVYIYIREHHTLPGKLVITVSLCLLSTYILLAVDMGARRRISHISCYAVGVMLHIFFLALFFWTNVLTYDVWKNLARLKVRSNGGKNSKSPGGSNLRAYFNYSAYAWTAATITAMPAVIVDNINGIDSSYQPHFGYKRCWLSGTKAFLLYFNAPVGVILFCNAIMFALTAYALVGIRKDTAILEKKKNKQRLYLYLKLFFLMGFTWSTEYIPLITGIYRLYIVAGMLTSLHGVFLFGIFVCKRRIFQQISKRWKETKEINGKLPTPTATTSTSI